MPDIRRDPLNLAFVQPLIPSLQAGTASGLCGFLAGGGIGILRSAHPGLVAAFTGTQFFVLGSSFLYTREAILKAGFTERTKRADLVSSTAAGAVSGAAAGAFYGRFNSLVGAILVGGLGHLGQRYVHARAGSTSSKDQRPLMDRLADSKWFPFRSISNSEYEHMLTEKLLKVEAEISLIDDKIATLRHGQKDNSTRPV